MRFRLMLAAIVALLLMVLGAGQAFARCYTPCLPGQNCLQVCREIPEIT